MFQNKCFHWYGARNILLLEGKTTKNLEKTKKMIDVTKQKLSGEWWSSRKNKKSADFLGRIYASALKKNLTPIILDRTICY